MWVCPKEGRPDWQDGELRLVLLVTQQNTFSLCWTTMLAILFANGFIPPEAHAAVRLGRTTALVVGNFFRRLVARISTQQVSEDVEKATKPTSRMRMCECPTNTVGDGRKHHSVVASSFRSLLLRFPILSCGRDDMETVNFVPQGEGREQGHPLMPLLFCLGQHRGLCVVAERLGPREDLVAFLDDVCAQRTVQQQLWTPSGRQ